MADLDIVASNENIIISNFDKTLWSNMLEHIKVVNPRKEDIISRFNFSRARLYFNGLEEYGFQNNEIFCKLCNEVKKITIFVLIL